MSNIFLSSDAHFHHQNILNFKRKDGVTPLRVFDDVTHMNEYIVMQHNRVVGPKDKWYCLGDVTMGRNAKSLEILSRMNGEKVLIKGNHDLASAHMYLAHFKDIRASHQLDSFLLTHIPVHVNSLSRWPCNVHGHLHEHVVEMDVMVGDAMTNAVKPDPRYFSVCMEQLDDYTPISLEDLKKESKFRLEHSF